MARWQGLRRMRVVLLRRSIDSPWPPFKGRGIGSPALSSTLTYATLTYATGSGSGGSRLRRGGLSCRKRVCGTAPTAPTDLALRTSGRSCVYRKLRLGCSGDAVHRGEHVT